MKNILISTGGSGGHVVPAKILSEHLHSKFNVFKTGIKIYLSILRFTKKFLR